MSRKVFFIILALFFFLSVSAQDDVAGNESELKKEDFIKSIVKADNIFIGLFLQGGKTKARVRVEESLVGDAKEDVVVNNIDNEKLRLKVKRAEFQKGDRYIFITRKDGDEFKLLENSITIPVSNNQADFSFNAPYMINFWQSLDIRLIEVAVTGIREKADKINSDSTRDTFLGLIKEYFEKNSQNDLKAALTIAYITGIGMDFETYNKLVASPGTLGCLAVKYSAGIMGEIYFNQNILTKAETFNQDSQTAFAIAAMEISSKQGAKILGKILNNVSMYTPPSSECFPFTKPPSNKEVFIRSVIEIDAPDTAKILSLQLESGDAEWLASILNIISEYEGIDLTELVLAAATNERMSERKYEFSNYFDKIKTPTTAQNLISLFDKNGDLYWKKIILATLGKYQYKETLPFLIKTLNEDPKEELRTSAAIAVGQLNQVGGAKPLYDFVVREKSILAKSIAIDALAQIGDRSVQDFLKEIIKNEQDPKIREAAVNAVEDNLFILRYGRKKN
ncbi:MAG TPA: HEAT repeat domain-containing protein [bacterium]|nr:HEAT repeat domain-containing protein [bacterium]HPS29169.1 HEAT repeat domain-containing protein [bacterium]